MYTPLHKLLITFYLTAVDLRFVVLDPAEVISNGYVLSLCNKADYNRAWMGHKTSFQHLQRDKSITSVRARLLNCCKALMVKS